MEIVGKKSQGLSVTALNEDKTVILSFNDRSLNFYVTDSLKESLKDTINSKIEEGFKHFVLNLENVKIIDSCGVGLIIVANNVTAAKNGSNQVHSATASHMTVLELMPGIRRSFMAVPRPRRQMYSKSGPRDCPTARFPLWYRGRWVRSPLHPLSDPIGYDPVLRARCWSTPSTTLQTHSCEPRPVAGRPAPLPFAFARCDPIGRDPASRLRARSRLRAAI